jgi:nitrite reductase/ring-hydroxylating ferredoxin subunit
MHMRASTTVSDLSKTSERLGSRSDRPRVSTRPQRLHTWFNLIPVAEFDEARPERVSFLDSWVTIRELEAGERRDFEVLFEGRQPMCVVVRFGIVFVWYGSDLSETDRPFPTLFADPYDSRYVSSKVTVFEDTHVMDFVENGSDNLHFKAVHRWEHSRIYDHVVSPERVELKLETRFRFGSCSTRWYVRLLSRLVPKLDLTQEHVYHGPTLAVVRATGRGTPQMHALVSLTPEGANRTRVYVTVAVDPTTFPRWAERMWAFVSSRRTLCDLLAAWLANYTRNEFDIDAVIWEHRKVLRPPRLLPSEKNLADVMRWGETFYPPDFAPAYDRSPAGEPRWCEAIPLNAIRPREVCRFEVSGRELVAYRNDEGGLHVFDAHCPHQGAHLGYGGQVVGDGLRCPFHGFHFDARGRCLGTNPENRAKFIDNLALEPVEHRIVDGMVEVRIA